MPDLKDTFATLEQQNPGSNIAGYFNNGNFYYEVSKSEHLPAAVMLFDNLPRGAYIYTNLRNNHWLYTYTSSNGNSPGLCYISSKLGKTGWDVKNATKANTRAVRMVAGEGGVGPLGTAGGLFEAAKTLRAYNGQKANTAERGLHRALRYYMLAAYAVLGKCAKNNYGEGNYVCALAVDDTGKIISWGVNSGYFHHGEVNMLLNYFSANAGAATLPPKTMVFSTLTPCKQCSDYLQAVRPADSKIFMGQKDTGEFGKAGEAHAEYLSQLTDPVLNREIVQDREWVQVDSKPVPHKFKRGATYWKPVYGWRNYEYVDHYSVDQALNSMVTPGNIAKKVGQQCRRELIDSHDTIARKFIKDRTQVKDLKDQTVKIAVLSYLDGWLKTVTGEVKEKIIPA